MPVYKWVNTLNKHFSKDDKQLANKLRKGVQITDHQKDANQDTPYYFMASIFFFNGVSGNVGTLVCVGVL